MNFKKLEKESRILFIIALILATTSFVLQTTLWKIPGYFYDITLKGLTLPLVFIRFLIVIQTYSRKLIILIFATLLIIALIKVKTENYAYILYPFLFTVSAKYIYFHKIVKIIFYLTLPIIILSIIASKLGVIENKLFYRPDGTIRQSLGVIYPTDFASHAFYLILSYFYIKNGIIKIYDYFIVFLVSYGLLRYCDAKLDSISIMIFIGCLLIANHCKKSKKNKNLLYKYIIIFSIPLCALLTYLLTANYDSQNPFYMVTNILLSGRLHLGYEALTEKGIKFLGQTYIQYGGDSGIFYNFIDSSYLVLLIIYGLYYFTLVMFAHICICYKSYKNRNYLMIAILIVIGIHSMVSQHFMEFAYNPFYLYLFAKDDISHHSH